jgi:hypothetical protein|nr:hypothetical protein [Paraburkholderia sp. BL8N3]
MSQVGNFMLDRLTCRSLYVSTVRPHPPSVMQANSCIDGLRGQPMLNTLSTAMFALIWRLAPSPVKKMSFAWFVDRLAPGGTRLSTSFADVDGEGHHIS